MAFKIIAEVGFKKEIKRSWYSPAYGIIAENKLLKFTYRGKRVPRARISLSRIY